MLSLLAFLSGGMAQTAQARYLDKALGATDYIQREFYDEKAGLYRPSLPPDPKALPYDFMWANGVQFSALVGATKHRPQRYRPILDAFTKGLRRYWDEQAPIPGFDAYFSSPNGDDKYYDDNAWLVLGFVEAYHVTGERSYLDWAGRTQQFVWSGWDDKLGGGIYWHQQARNSKNTCSNAPTAAAALELYFCDHDADHLDRARKIYAWTRSNLQDKDGLFWDNINLNGKIGKRKWTYNTALMIRSSVGLWRATKESKYLQEARREADAALKQWVNPQTGSFADSARFNHLLSEALLITYEATRDVKYLNAVRRDADFGYRYVRDPENGGYWNQWKAENHASGERKSLIENASVARLFWLLTPYPDVEELQSQAQAADRRGDRKTAIRLLQQALDSTAGAPPPVRTPEGDGSSSGDR
jgi:uncharacterized protein YyaL (SSP411 family)